MSADQRETIDALSRDDSDKAYSQKKPTPWTSRLQLNRLSGLYLLALLILIFSLWIPDVFLSTATLQGVISDQSISVILAIGVLIALAAGQFDLSAAAVLGFCALCSVWFNSALGLDPWMSVLLSILVGVAIGLLNGFLVAIVGINSFIATLGSSSIILAMASLLSGDRFVGPASDEFRAISLASLGPVPLLLVYVLIVATVAWYLLEHTTIGRRLQATGANIDTARLVGVGTKRYVVASLVLCSTLAAIAGVLAAAKTGTVTSTFGTTYLLPAFAGCFLGTTQLKPGRFNVWGTVLALALLGTGVKGFQLASGMNWITYLFNGVALLIAVGLAVFFERRRSAASA